MVNPNKGREPNIQLVVMMSPALFERLNAHMEQIGERNRSAWIRYAITAKIRQEVGELRDE